MNNNPPNMESGPMVANPSIRLSDTELVACTCGHSLFKQLVSLRKVSALFTGTGREEYVPVPALICDKCGKEFKPNRLIQS